MITPFLLFCLFTTVFTSEVILEQLFEEIHHKTPITRCCNDTERYKLPTGQCRRNEFEYNEYNGLLPVHFTRQNETVSASNLTFPELGEKLDNCTDENGIFVTTEFELYENGTLLLLRDGTTLQPNEFCLNPFSTEGGLIARYCAPEPCNNSTSCVKKCCPIGMAINATSGECEWSSLKFVIDFKNETGDSIQPESYVIRDGGTPLFCAHGMNLLEPDENEMITFYILPDGRLYQPSLPEDSRYTNEYCLDNVLSDSISKNMAVLLCLPPEIERSEYEQFTKGFFPYLLFVSSLFLIATFIVYAMLPEIRNVHGVTIMCHVASLAVMYIGLGIIQSANLAPFPDWACVGLGVIVHFAFLSTFTWLNVMSFDIWWTFSRRRASRRKSVARAFWMRTLSLNAHRHVNDDDDGGDDSERVGGGYVAVAGDGDEEPSASDWDLRPHKVRNGSLTRRFVFYSLYAWGVPLVIVSTGQILERMKKETGGDFIAPKFEIWCWFKDEKAFLAYLFGPVGVLIVSNIGFFLMTASLFYRASVDASFAANRIHAWQKLRVIFSLFILMGVSWMLEVIAFAVGDKFIFVVPDIFNILIGVFIFVIFVCKPNVWKLLKLKFSCFERFDVWCPRCMNSSGTRQDVMRVTNKNDDLPANAKTDAGDDELKGRHSCIASSVTQIDDLGEDMLDYHGTC